MAENKLADMSTEFAIQILKLTDGIKGHYSLSNQLERSGTSIGANIREAKYAHSRPDFIAKLQIALKECYETEYWIEKENIMSSSKEIWLHLAFLLLCFVFFSVLQRSKAVVVAEISYKAAGFCPAERFCDAVYRCVCFS